MSAFLLGLVLGSIGGAMFGVWAMLWTVAADLKKLPDSARSEFMEALDQ